MKSVDIVSTISSPELASGLLPPASLGGGTTDPCSPLLAHASLSARQAQERGLLTSGTYGPTPSISSASYALQQQLASRLQAKTALFGSTLYKLTWKERVTPSGRSIPALRGSVRRTSGNDCIGWPTPTTTDSSRHPSADFTTPNITLNHAAILAGWPTPIARDGDKLDATPSAIERREAAGREIGLAMKARMASEDGWSMHPGPARLTATGQMLTGSDAGTISGGQLSPVHSLWLMLGPLAIVWASCGEAVTRSTSRKRNTSSKV